MVLLFMMLKYQEFGFSSNQVGMSADDGESDINNNALCDCGGDEHTCGEEFTCPICEAEEKFYEVILMDHVYKIHSIDMYVD